MVATCSSSSSLHTAPDRGCTTRWALGKGPARQDDISVLLRLRGYVCAHVESVAWPWRVESYCSRALLCVCASRVGRGSWSGRRFRGTFGGTVCTCALTSRHAQPRPAARAYSAGVGTGICSTETRKPEPETLTLDGVAQAPAKAPKSASSAGTIYIHIYTYICIYIHTYIHTYMYRCLHMLHISYICLCMCVCVCVKRFVRRYFLLPSFLPPSLHPTPAPLHPPPLFLFLHSSVPHLSLSLRPSSLSLRRSRRCNALG